MQKYLIFILALNIYACSNPNKKEHSKITVQQEKTGTFAKPKSKILQTDELTFSRKDGKAILIGEKIKLLDTDLEFIADISNLSESIVNIKGVSDSLFKQNKEAKEFCKSFWYVKIQIDTIVGVVDGRQVFEILNSNQFEKFVTNGNNIELFRTRFFGIGVEYKGDLMGCPVDQPIVLNDTAKKYYGLVDLVQNDYSKEASWGETYPYFELINDDGGQDKIETITVRNSKIMLRVHREFQEGENDSDIVLSYDNGRYKAEYLNFGKIRYK